MEPLEILMGLLPEETAKLAGTPPEDCTELRIRAGRPVQWVTLRSRYFTGAPVEGALMGKTVSALAEHSLYARETELKEGFFTLRGGCRAGVCGRYIPGEGRICPEEIGSVNVRIARSVPGAADRLMEKIWNGGQMASCLILSAPGGGKTTLLRDLVRQASEGGVRVGLADERGEVAACHRGIPTLDVGPETDVLDGCPKSLGIPMLVRVMSPEMVATDELGGEGDVQAVREAARCGVGTVATAHAGSLEEALLRRDIGGMIREGLFEKVVFLRGPGKEMEIWDGAGIRSIPQQA